MSALAWIMLGLMYLGIIVLAYNYFKPRREWGENQKWKRR